MPKAIGFESLECWKTSMQLAEDIYRLTASGNISKDFGLRDQIRRSAVSIASNIAEGKERETTSELVRFLYIAKGSAGELRTQIALAHRIGYFSGPDSTALNERLLILSKMLSQMIKAIHSRA